jgi:hypothetical protein
MICYSIVYRQDTNNTRILHQRLSTPSDSVTPPKNRGGEVGFHPTKTGDSFSHS